MRTAIQNNSYIALRIYMGCKICFATMKMLRTQSGGRSSLLTHMEILMDTSIT